MMWVFLIVNDRMLAAWRVEGLEGGGRGCCRGQSCFWSLRKLKFDADLAIYVSAPPKFDYIAPDRHIPG